MASKLIVIVRDGVDSAYLPSFHRDPEEQGYIVSFGPAKSQTGQVAEGAVNTVI